jgi:hypothetical protein
MRSRRFNPPIMRETFLAHRFAHFILKTAFRCPVGARSRAGQTVGSIKLSAGMRRIPREVDLDWSKGRNITTFDRPDGICACETTLSPSADSPETTYRFGMQSVRTR